MANSRELDTALGAYAVLFAETKDKRWAEKYRRLVLNLACQRVIFDGFESDPTVANDLLPAFRYMREQGVFSAQEQQSVASWTARMVNETTFSPQHSRHGR